MPGLKLIFVGGFSQRSSGLSPLAAEFEGMAECDLTSVSEFAAARIDSGIEYKESLSHRLDPSKKNILVGWSTGGTVSLELAASSPDSVAGVVLVGSTACFLQREDYSIGVPPAKFAALVRGIKGGKSEVLRKFNDSMCYPESNPEETAKVLQQSLSTNSEILLDNLEYLREDFRYCLCKIKSPLLVIHDLLDQVVPVEHAKYIENAINNNIENPKACYSNKYGHLLVYRAPELVASQIKDFLGKFTSKL